MVDIIACINCRGIIIDCRRDAVKNLAGAAFVGKPSDHGLSVDHNRAGDCSDYVCHGIFGSRKIVIFTAVIIGGHTGADIKIVFGASCQAGQIHSVFGH